MTVIPSVLLWFGRQLVADDVAGADGGIEEGSGRDELALVEDDGLDVGQVGRERSTLGRGRSVRTEVPRGPDESLSLLAADELEEALVLAADPERDVGSPGT